MRKRKAPGGRGLFSLPSFVLFWSTKGGDRTKAIVLVSGISKQMIEPRNYSSLFRELTRYYFPKLGKALEIGQSG
jgi:hypothetical protein